MASPEGLQWFKVLVCHHLLKDKWGWPINAGLASVGHIPKIEVNISVMVLQFIIYHESVDVALKGFYPLS